MNVKSLRVMEFRLTIQTCVMVMEPALDLTHATAMNPGMVNLVTNLIPVLGFLHLTQRCVVDLEHALQ
ncbi:MAG: hypothetical protein ACTSUE_14025 [Promethearchaeota archaeon]